MYVFPICDDGVCCSLTNEKNAVRKYRIYVHIFIDDHLITYGSNNKEGKCTEEYYKTCAGLQYSLYSHRSLYM